MAEGTGGRLRIFTENQPAHVIGLTGMTGIITLAA
jgi:hypothetical protein